MQNKRKSLLVHPVAIYWLFFLYTFVQLWFFSVIHLTKKKKRKNTTKLKMKLTESTIIIIKMFYRWYDNIHNIFGNDNSPNPKRFCWIKHVKWSLFLSLLYHTVQIKVNVNKEKS